MSAAHSDAAEVVAPRGWPDPERPGWPEKPKRAIYHWLMREGFAEEPIPVRWQPGLKSWRTGPAQADNMTPEQIVAEGFHYLGPALLPCENAQPAASDAELMREMAEVLRRARQFIINGVTFGHIQMPDDDTPDAAHDTLPAIEAALARYDAQQRGAR